jgi:SAM-dependent methyltransferase
VPMLLTQSQIEKKLRNEDLDELLHLWWTEQGAEKLRDLDLIASAIPFPKDATLRVLDLCCGPGDVGRAIRARYPKSRIDCVDRDVFLISICIRMNRREGVPGQNFVRDLRDANWHNGLEAEYDVVATANALHWLDAHRVAQVFQDVFRLLRPGGVFLFVEPACSEKRFAAGFAEWKSRQPSRYSRENWERFWSRANEILGYDHTKFLGSRDSHLMGDEGMPVLGWIQFLKNVRFESVDALLRDADDVILAGAKPSSTHLRPSNELNTSSEKMQHREML